MKLTCIILFFSVIFISGCLPRLQDTDVDHPVLSYQDTVIHSDTIWHGVVDITGVVVVGRQATLSITPGTIIRFHKIDRNRDGIGDSELRVLGRLLAQGDTDTPIIFTSAEKNKTPMDWSYVLIYSSGKQNIIDHCRFSYAFSGLQVHFSTATVSHSSFFDNNEGLRFGRAKLQITDNIFRNNRIGVRFTRMEGPATLSRNRITANQIGLFLVPSGQNIMDFFKPDRGSKVWNTGRLTISNNDIYENIWYNLNLGEKQVWDLDVRNNWWGTTDPLQIQQAIFDKSRDASLGKAIIVPFSSSPIFPR